MGASGQDALGPPQSFGVRDDMHSGHRRLSGETGSTHYDDPKMDNIA